MGVYSDTEIRHALIQGHIVCHPLIDDNIRGSSIDLTLGQWYYECDDRAAGGIPGIYNPFDEDDVARYFVGPIRAKPWDPWETGGDGRTLAGELSGIPVDHPLIMLKPRTRILAHSHEFVGIHPPGTTEMRARSSWGRNGIAVCLCAGWGDPGYINRWTMEIHNHNDEAVPLPIGERVAQLIFHRTGPVSGHYGSGGKYQTSEELDEVVRGWRPSAMLPRSYKDERKLPMKTEADVGQHISVAT